jgi:hypothetical protein
MISPAEERVFWQDIYLAETFDFRSRIIFVRYDGCTFVNCKLLFDAETEQVAFTDCVFQDCNIDRLECDNARGIRAENNRFERPIEIRRQEFGKRLDEAIKARARNV